MEGEEPTNHVTRLNVQASRTTSSMMLQEFPTVVINLAKTVTHLTPYANMTSTQAQTHLRSLYRRIMRELPPRPSASTTTASKSPSRSPLHTSIRSHLTGSAPLPPTSSTGAAGAAAPAESQLARRQELEQFVQYLQAQRVYGVLLERYNPGTGMDEEERVRLTARRVGMDLPVEYDWKPNR